MWLQFSQLKMLITGLCTLQRIRNTTLLTSSFNYYVILIPPSCYLRLLSIIFITRCMWILWASSVIRSLFPLFFSLPDSLIFYSLHSPKTQGTYKLETNLPKAEHNNTTEIFNTKLNEFNPSYFTTVSLKINFQWE